MSYKRAILQRLNVENTRNEAEKAKEEAGKEMVKPAKLHNSIFRSNLTDFLLYIFSNNISLKESLFDYFHAFMVKFKTYDIINIFSINTFFCYRLLLLLLA